VVKVQILAVRSAEVVSSNEPSWLKRTELRRAVCPTKETEPFSLEEELSDEEAYFEMGSLNVRRMGSMVATASTVALGLKARPTTGACPTSDDDEDDEDPAAVGARPVPVEAAAAVDPAPPPPPPPPPAKKSFACWRTSRGPQSMG
jgi:hypothetical protein